MGIDEKLMFFLFLRKRAILKQKIAPSKKPEGLTGIALLEFSEPHSEDPEKTYGVCVFAIPPGDSHKNYEKDLWGPCGFSSTTDWRGTHLYGRDTWGVVQDYQFEANPMLKFLKEHLPDETEFLLAGVRFPLRSIWGNPSNFILVRKTI